MQEENTSLRDNVNSCDIDMHEEPAGLNPRLLEMKIWNLCVILFQTLHEEPVCSNSNTCRSNLTATSTYKNKIK